MRQFFFAILVFVTFDFTAGVSADTISPIKGTVTPVGLGRACSDAGGSFHSSSTGYSCEKKNCNGKGGTCGVYCGSNGKCNGSTPQAPGQGNQPIADVTAVLTNTLGKVTGGAGKPPTTGILDGGSGFSRQGPTATGAPAAPAAPAGGGMIR